MRDLFEEIASLSRLPPLREVLPRPRYCIRCDVEIVGGRGLDDAPRFIVEYLVWLCFRCKRLGGYRVGEKRQTLQSTPLSRTAEAALAALAAGDWVEYLNVAGQEVHHAMMARGYVSFNTHPDVAPKELYTITDGGREVLRRARVAREQASGQLELPLETGGM